MSEPAPEEDDGTSRGRARSETLAIPGALRVAVDERDQLHCRVCGRHMGAARALHHILYGGSRQGMGGRREHDLANLITVCWMYGPTPGKPSCHDLVHSNKTLWQPLLLQVIATPGVTAFQLRRWSQARSRPQPDTTNGVPRDATW